MKIRRFGMAIPFLSLMTCARTSPEATAKSFFKAEIAGDLIPAYGMLASRDQAAVPREEFIREGAEGMPGMILDSVTRKRGEGGDTATAYIYGRAPNREQAIRELMQDGLNLTDTAAARDRMNRKSHSLPLITTIDSLTLLREKSGWRVWLGLAEQKHLGAIAARVNGTYLKQPLTERREMTREFFRLAREAPRFVPNNVKKKMEEVVEQANCADRLRFSLRVDEGYMKFVTGSLFNGCARDIEEVRFEIVDANGETSYIVQNGVAAGKTAHVIDETSIATGAVKRIDVLGIDFVGQEK
jgi:hypothetical protein